MELITQGYQLHHWQLGVLENECLDAQWASHSFSLSFFNEMGSELLVVQKSVKPSGVLLVGLYNRP